MLTKSILNALKKMNVRVERGRNGQYSATGNKYIVTWYDQEGNANCVNVRRHNDHHDSQSDYCAGFFADTLKLIIRYISI